MQLYPQSAHNAFHGVNIMFPQHIDQAVAQIHSACKGMGTDEQALISVLGSKSPETRNLIALRYMELYKKPLRDLIKSETSGNFGKLLRMISTPLSETEAHILRDATKGVGTNESLLVQILSGRTNEEMSILKKTYFSLFNKDLGVTLSSELSGDFKKVIMAMLQSSQLEYNPQFHTATKAEADAIALYKAGQGRIGTQEEIFIGILVACPPDFLRMVDSVYVAKYNNNIAKAVDKEFSGDAKKSLNYLVKLVMDPYPTIAEVFEKTMKGFGTDETGLSTALVRYQSVLPQVKAAYKKLYNKELRDRIYGETSGDYRKLLLEIYDAPQDPPLTKAGAAQAPGVVSAQAYGGAPAAQGYPGQTAPVAGGYPGHASAAGIPPQQSAYSGPPQAGYPAQAHSQPGYAPAPAQPGHPAAQPHSAQPGYPPQQQPGYPAQSQPGYPAQPQPGYPAQPQPGYPPQQQPGYPPQQPGYPAQPGYPPQQPGYPPAQPGYPPQQQPGYPPPQQPGYPAQPGYPPQQPGYPPAQPGYPQQPGYPPQQPGYPPQQPGYPPQQQPGYPPQGQYPPPGQYPPQGYPPRGY